MARIRDTNALNALGNLIKLLPTGTIFMFQFLSPVLSNTGHCHQENKYLMEGLLAICGLSCAFATFTDSHNDEEGNTHYGVVTMKGMRRLGSRFKDDSRYVDLSEFRVRMGDCVHAMIGLLVFGVVCVLDTDTVNCFAPSWEGYSRQCTLAVLPFAVGVISSVVFAVFPSKRNGIGYPSERIRHS